MRTWRRARLTGWCNVCGSTIHRGDPVLDITTPGVDRIFRRCGQCAPAPADLPPLVDTPPAEEARVLDWKTRATGEEES